MRASLRRASDAIKEFLEASGGEDDRSPIGEVLAVAAYVAGVVRNTTGLAVVLTKALPCTQDIEACLCRAGIGVRDLQLHEVADQSNFAEKAGMTLGIWPGKCRACDCAVMSYLQALRSEYRGMIGLAESRRETHEPDAFLRAASVFTVRAVDALLCFSMASLQLLSIMGTADAPVLATEAERSEVSFQLVGLLEDAGMFGLLSPLHRRVVLYAVVLLC
jgi:hypothetical protein